jgi:hypothetical protein
MLIGEKAGRMKVVFQELQHRWQLGRKSNFGKLQIINF